MKLRGDDVWDSIYLGTVNKNKNLVIHNNTYNFFVLLLFCHPFTHFKKTKNKKTHKFFFDEPLWTMKHTITLTNNLYNGRFDHLPLSLSVIVTDVLLSSFRLSKHHYRLTNIINESFHNHLWTYNKRWYLSYARVNAMCCIFVLCLILVVNRLLIGQ